MAIYLVKAKPKMDTLSALRKRLDSGEVSQMLPFGKTLDHSLNNARLGEDGWAFWEELDYCDPPLAQEREAVLDEHFTDITVKPVEKGKGWEEIAGLKPLWSQVISNKR